MNHFDEIKQLNTDIPGMPVDYIHGEENQVSPLYRQTLTNHFVITMEEYVQLHTNVSIYNSLFLVYRNYQANNSPTPIFNGIEKISFLLNNTLPNNPKNRFR